MNNLKIHIFKFKSKNQRTSICAYESIIYKAFSEFSASLLKNDCRIKGKEVNPEGFYRTTEAKAGDFYTFFTSIATNVAAVFSDQNCIGKTADGRKKKIIREEENLSTGKNFLCTGKKNLCTGKNFLCTGKKFLCTGKKFLCTGKILLHTVENLSMRINKIK